MLTPQNSREDLECLRLWLNGTRLCRFPKSPRNKEKLFCDMPVRRMTIRQAVLSDSEIVEVERAEGRVLAQETVSCPPAVPIGVSGEEVTREMICLFQEYGIYRIAVVACHE